MASVESSLEKGKGAGWGMKDVGGIADAGAASAGFVDGFMLGCGCGCGGCCCCC